jgi:hypothetical protein
MVLSSMQVFLNRIIIVISLLKKFDREDNTV